MNAEKEEKKMEKKVEEFVREDKKKSTKRKEGKWKGEQLKKERQGEEWVLREGEAIKVEIEV